MFVCCYCIFSYIVLIIHISRITQDKITMPQPPHTHRNHPPITPHSKIVFLPDLSVCITNSSKETPSRCINASLSYLPSQKSLRFLTHHHPRQTPHHQTHHHTHPRVHTHIYIYIYICHRSTFAYLTSSFTGTYHSHPTCSRSLLRFTTSSTFETNRYHHESEQLDERWLCLL